MDHHLNFLFRGQNGVCCPSLGFLLLLFMDAEEGFLPTLLSDCHMFFFFHFLLLAKGSREGEAKHGR
jgi:hypothetical protein